MRTTTTTTTTTGYVTSSYLTLSRTYTLGCRTSLAWPSQNDWHLIVTHRSTRQYLLQFVTVIMRLQRISYILRLTDDVIYFLDIVMGRIRRINQMQYRKHVQLQRCSQCFHNAWLAFHYWVARAPAHIRRCLRQGPLAIGLSGVSRVRS